MPIKTICTALTVLTLAAGSASAATILSTDFDNRTVNGNTASNIDWTANGVAAPTDLTVTAEDFSGGALAPTFFGTTAAQNRLGVDLNIENEGSWFIDVALNTLADGINLTELAFDGFIFNNSGNLQTLARELDFTLAILRNSDGSVVFTGEEDNVHERDANGVGGPFDVSFDLTGISLNANTDYTIKIGANSDRRNRGNNGGFDNLALTGEVVAAVPLPAGGLLLMTALAGLALRRKIAR